MYDRIRSMVFAAVIVGLCPLAQSVPVDVDGDGRVGPREVIDLAENWKGPALQQGGIQPWRIDGSNIFFDTGNVGVGGAASSTNRLLVTGSDTLDTAAFGSTAKGPNFSHIHYGPTGDWYIRSAASNGKVILQDSGGYVGIGTTNPEEPLTVFTTLGYGLLHTDGVREVGSYINSQGGWLGTKSDHPLHFFTGNSNPQVTLSTGGDLGVGTSEPFGSRLEVVASGLFKRAITAVAADGVGIYGISEGAGFASVVGKHTQGVGVFGEGSAGVHGVGAEDGDIGIVGVAPVNGLAGQFVGDIEVSGLVLKSAETSRIDHPLDPANKFLQHGSVESPETSNIYFGITTTDATGTAIVTLPDYFEAFNRNFHYQLTVIGQFAQAIVEEKIKNNRFTIRTDKPNVEVSWQVTGVRNDAYAKSHPVEVEKAKSEEERGKYLAPELFGQPKEKGIHYRPDLEKVSSASKSIGE